VFPLSGLITRKLVSKKKVKPTVSLTGLPSFQHALKGGKGSIENVGT
jgi:hypothetical protein